MKFLIFFATSAILLQYHSSNSLPKDVGKYKFLSDIGKGNTSTVYLAIHVPTEVKVAIKIMSKIGLNEEEKEKLQTEVDIMKELEHPNIVKLLQVINTDKKLYIVMEEASGGDMNNYSDDRSDSKRTIDEKDARAKFRQMVLAVHYLHKMDIAHMDLHLGNILLDSKKNIKIADFGLSSRFSSKSKSHEFIVASYAAPEIVQNELFGPEADVWQLGGMLHVMVCSSSRFNGIVREDVLTIIENGYSPPENVSEDLADLLRRILVVDPKKRITLEAIMQHKWTNEEYDDELKPYIQPKQKLSELKQIKKALTELNYEMEIIKKSIEENNYEDDLFATYLILGGKSKKAHSEDTVIKSLKRKGSTGNSPPPKLQKQQNASPERSKST